MTPALRTADRPRALRRAALPGSALLLAALCVTSLFVGSGGIGFAQTLDALTGGGEDDTTTLLVREYRVPRTVLALLVGAALGLAGTVVQALTRNPLADPGILGVNAGAYTAVVFGAAFLGAGATAGQVWFGLAGAAVTATLVHVIGTTGAQAGSPVKLVLTGVAVGAVLSGVAFAVSIVRPEVFDRVRFWQVGSLQGRRWETVLAVLPFVVVGVALTLALTRPLNALALGDDTAASLGTRVLVARLAGLAAVTLLCGAATAAAGPISFLGLMVAHAVRAVTGPDLRRVLPVSLLAAPALFLAADILGRVLVPSELPVGIVTAFLGAPLLILLTRRRGGGRL
ncbi:FecCD family ABC transporter permease [Streptomyces marincola]|uniref:FecCD family ABC transporter permease n=1 Tax=Streptomyces marincola TaxID=2878388 RepID=UPI001CF48F06|nr:iron chelate uptake ABC transporter family permease subunit [Streptomyces marincola]UCM91472.1 iron chelate uptake ABC transporter family permease subunit [Streptomyces marincola]